MHSLHKLNPDSCLAIAVTSFCLLKQNEHSGPFGLRFFLCGYRLLKISRRILRIRSDVSLVAFANALMDFGLERSTLYVSFRMLRSF